MATGLPHGIPARVVKLSDAIPLSEVMPDERAGSISDLVGQTIHIYRVETFTSETYQSQGFRLVLRVTNAGVETTGDMLFTGFAKPVLRVVLHLLGDPNAVLKTLDPPIAAEVFALGASVGLR